MPICCQQGAEGFSRLRRLPDCYAVAVSAPACSASSLAHALGVLLRHDVEFRVRPLCRPSPRRLNTQGTAGVVAAAPLRGRFFAWLADHHICFFGYLSGGVFCRLLSGMQEFCAAFLLGEDGMPMGTEYWWKQTCYQHHVHLVSVPFSSQQQSVQRIFQLSAVTASRALLRSLLHPVLALLYFSSLGVLLGCKLSAVSSCRSGVALSE